ncbi:MAG: DUF1343 domain-containing protein [Microscillaceae bacterium]|nr:DUF1343 domain-containing protein [Microscillaceae bacterium]
MQRIFVFWVLLVGINACRAQTSAVALSVGSHTSPEALAIQTGTSQMLEYLPLLHNKRVGVVVNHTALVGKAHLVDTLLSLGIKIQKVFAPEHGFRGNADAGEVVQNSTDSRTGLPIVSLYGKNKKPSAEQLSDLDIVVFDIQDVGVRFYTYISTLHYVMEACAENQKKLLVLDRPNPNGGYVDGPTREYKFKSFVGMHPIPIVHGLTVGELAQMINGEKWLKHNLQCDLQVILNKNYQHQLPYSLPVRPSPNLPNDLAIQLYPSICLFEGTIVSVGRGTDFPFQVVGAPEKQLGSFAFTPRSIEGMSKNPIHKDQTCYGIDFRHLNQYRGQFTLKYVIDFYTKTANKSKFFNKYFDTLLGTAKVREQIIAGLSEKEIRAGWEKDLQAYKLKRQKYLLYP